MTTYQFRQLGSTGPRVFPLGLGCMGMSDMRPCGRGREASPRFMQHSTPASRYLIRVITMQRGHNELLIGRALHDRRDTAILSVKFGRCVVRTGAGSVSIRDQLR